MIAAQPWTADLSHTDALQEVLLGDPVLISPSLTTTRGTTASSESADVVLTADRVDGLADAIFIARRSRRIARRAAGIGMLLSFAAMVPAAAGLLAPAAGAVLQEAIDVAAIGIALTVLLPARVHTVRLSPSDLAAAQRLYAQHKAVRPLVEQVRAVADGLSTAGADLQGLRRLLDRLDSELVPHEEAEEAELLPIMARALGGTDPTGALSRTHAEIEIKFAGCAD